MTLKALRDKARKQGVRVAQWEARVSGAPRGKKTKAREGLTKARVALRVAEKALAKEERRIAREIEKQRRKVQRQRERLKIEVDKIRKEQEKLLGGGPSAPPVAPSLPVKPKPGPKRAPTPAPIIRQPDPTQYPGRSGVYKFLVDDEGWRGYQPPLTPDSWDADTEIEQEGGPFEITPLAGWMPRDNVWYRAVIDMRYMLDDRLEVQELLDAINEPDGSLGRKGEKGERDFWATVNGGTEWHHDPAKLDKSIQAVIQNVRDKYNIWPEWIVVTIMATSRDEKPESPRKHLRRKHLR